MNEFLPAWLLKLKPLVEDIIWVHEVRDMTGGDIAFYLGCGEIVPPAILSLYERNLVVHASDLPKGKGWSPLAWQILEGKSDIPVSLFEAAERVDSGPIYLKRTLSFRGTELIDEMRRELARATFEMCGEFLDRYPGIVAEAVPQEGEATFYPKRTPADSRLNPDLSIRDQFALMRVADNERYPCYFELDGDTFVVKVEKKKVT
uniref:Methionyl-tRNA formyltransferase n=2 Tax=Cohnella candidum TaxID=2674991 RepID=A0A3G3K5E8_9BACL|nr:methionyl-tRNA formyltransferase [Cohnella candidum]